uniref:Putative secreted peptide n=1 Tax=Anopheles braziliensis TaxID=58242 RepID=A0A2M3ZXH1_9DIPT
MPSAGLGLGLSLLHEPRAPHAQALSTRLRDNLHPGELKLDFLNTASHTHLISPSTASFMSQGRQRIVPEARERESEPRKPEM